MAFVWTELPKVAVMVAGWFALTTAAAVAAKVVEAEPAGTMTGDGTLRLLVLLPTETAVPPVGATELSVTEQVELARAATELGVQIKLVICVVGVTVIVSPTPVRVRLDAAGVAPSVLATLMFVEPAVGAIVTFAVATIPLAIVLAFMPTATHVYAPDVPPQYKDLPAEVRTGPAATVTAEKADGG
jgi:hypothetical protein